MTTAAVIPIKQLSNAKQRLGGLLSVAQRRRLFSAMVEDVLTAVEACVLIDRILVVTDDAAVADLARRYGAEIQAEPASPGLIEAVTHTGKLLAGQGVTTMLFLPGDVPLVTPEELEIVLEGFGASNGINDGDSTDGDSTEQAPALLIVPARDLGGSNCLACSPPDSMTFGFGEDSFRIHLNLARTLGIAPTVIKLPGLGLDVDTPADLRDLVMILEGDKDGRGSHTIAYLITAGLIEQLTGGDTSDQCGAISSKQSPPAKGQSTADETPGQTRQQRTQVSE